MMQGRLDLVTMLTPAVVAFILLAVTWLVFERIEEREAAERRAGGKASPQ